MMKVILLAFVGLVLGHDFYITQPWAETKWKAGDTVSITWKLYQNVGPEASGINIDLMDGDDLSANYLQNIAANLNPDSCSYEWTIPRSVSSSDGVFIRITGIGEVANYRFSHRFSITDGEGPGLTVSVMPTVQNTLDVAGLVQALPTISRLSSIPPAPRLTNLDGAPESVTTVTVSVTSGINRDRLESSDANGMIMPYMLLLASLLAAFL